MPVKTGEASTVGESTLRASQSLARRVLRVVLGLYFTIAISITFFQLLLEYRNEKDRLVQEIDQVANTFRPIVLQALWNLDEIQVNSALEGILGTNQDVLSVELRDIDDVTTHLVNRKKDNATEQSQEASKNKLIERYYFRFDLVYTHEFTGSQDLGELIFITNSNVVLKRAAHTFYITIISAFVKTTILCLIFYLAVRAMIGRPMEHLSEVMRRLIPKSGNYSYDIELDEELLTRKDEVGVALNTFKVMKDALRQKEEALTDYQMLLEEKVAQRTKQLEKMSQAKSDFLANMSHEIRTPMNGVLGMVQLLADTPLDEQQKKYINIIQNSGESLIEIINSILDQLKIEAGKIELEIRDINLEKIIDDCANMFSFKSRETGVALIPVFHSSCPHWVKGDAMRIKQILNNLVANAFKFTHEGEVVIRVEKIRDLGGNQSLVRFSVSDTGIGIDETHLNRLFKPFSQADKSTTRKYGGTGLGLTISKQLAELMKGDIRVKSVVGEGSTFELDVPFEHCEEQEIQVLEEEDTQILVGKRLLVVDDHEAFGTVVQEVAEGWGMKVQTVSMAEQAKNIIAKSFHDKTPFDIAIVDIALPDLNGILLCKQLKEIHGDKMPRVMLVSAVKGIDSKEQLKEGNIDIFVEKPISNSELRSTLSKIARTAQKIESSKFKKGVNQYTDLHVLVAEDNVVNQMVIKGLLNKLGVEPIVVENGLLAVEECKRNIQSPFDLILMDCEMPEMDGWEASKKIRELDYKRSNGEHVNIHALSAHAMEKHLEKSKEAGMDGYIYKPIGLDTLDKLLKTI